MLVQVGKYSANNLYCPQKYILCCENISICPQFYIIIPSMLLMPQTCPEIFYASLHIVMLSLQTFWCPRNFFGVPPENYSLRENIFQPPKTFGWSLKFFVFQARIFWFLPFGNA